MKIGSTTYLHLVEIDEFDGTASQNNGKVVNRMHSIKPVIYDAANNTSNPGNASAAEETAHEQLPVTRDTLDNLSPLKTKSGRIVKKPIRFKDHES